MSDPASEPAVAEAIMSEPAPAVAEPITSEPASEPAVTAEPIIAEAASAVTATEVDALVDAKAADATPSEPILTEEMASKILRQVEFYFSVSNLPRDKFLREEMAKDPEEYVDLTLICSFSRMRQVLKLTVPNCPVPQSAVKAVADVLRASTLLSVSEDGYRVKRTLTIGDFAAVEGEVDARSLCIKPFAYDSTVDGLTTFFSQYGVVNCVRFRRFLNSKDFKGSIFVEFDSKETAKKVLDATMEYEGAQLVKEFKEDFFERIKVERIARAAAGKPIHQSTIRVVNSSSE